MITAVIDYGMSNMGSIRRSLEECGAEVWIVDDPKAVKEASHIILPGVGAFKDGMKNLRENGWDEALYRAVVEEQIPILGICLGMQLLAERGWEGGETKGLGLIPGEVQILKTTQSQERIPHIGWNEVWSTKKSRLLEHIPDGVDFYFVHSYHFAVANQEDIAARTDYGEGFVSVAERNHVFGTQFHPEKSGVYGFQILKNFLQMYW